MARTTITQGERDQRHARAEFMAYLHHLDRGGQPRDLGYAEYQYEPDAAIEAQRRARDGGAADLSYFAEREGMAIPSLTAINDPLWLAYSRAEPSRLLAAYWKLADALRALRLTMPEATREARILRRVWDDFTQFRCSQTHLDVLATLAAELEGLGAHHYVIQHIASTAAGLQEVGDIVFGFDAWSHRSADEWDRLLGRRMTFPGRR